MDYKDIRLYTEEGILLNLIHSFPKPYQLEDAVEDSKGPEELKENIINNVEHYDRQIELDRVRSNYFRYRLVDRNNNTRLLYIYLEMEE